MTKPTPKECRDSFANISRKLIDRISPQKLANSMEEELVNQDSGEEKKVNQESNDLKPENINKDLEASDLLPSTNREEASAEADKQIEIIDFEQEYIGELEELTQPLIQPPLPEPLLLETTVASPDGKLWRIVKLLKRDSQANLYCATSEEGHSIWLREAFSNSDTAARFHHEAKVLQGLNCPMFPRISACFDSNDRTYLITEEIVTERGTLADILKSENRKLSDSDMLSILAQVSLGLSQLHTQGWVHLGLRPTHIILSNPVKILDASYATPIGEKPTTPFAHAGYSPPELQRQEPVDIRSDIYAVGALLYQAVKAEKIPETGAELNLLPPIAGIKQILFRCLGDRNSRYPTMAELRRDLMRLWQRLQPTVSYSMAAATTIGLEPTRTTNQDAYAYLNGNLVSEQGEYTWGVACVADGMGGMAAGEVASEIAVQVILREAAIALTQSNEVSIDNQAEWVKQWVRQANQDVCIALKRERVKGGCTLVCACLVNRRLAIAHVGDCRIYRFREGDAHPLILTRDHSLVMARVLQGELKPEEVRHHPDRSIVTRSLGDRHPLPDYYVDTLETTTGQPVMDLQVGDVLLLCSDGMWEPVLEAELLQVVQNCATDLQATANALLKIALQRNSLDNTTFVLLRLDKNDVPKEG